MHEVPFYIQWYRLRSFWNFSDRLHSSLQIDPNWPIRSALSMRPTIATGYFSPSNQGQLGDRSELLDACLPEYPPYGKRPLIDNHWFQTICRDDVTLVTEAVDRVNGENVVTRSESKCRPT